MKNNCKKISANKLGITVLLLVVVVVSIACFITHQTASFALDTGTLEYVVYVNSDTGPVTLNYMGNQALLDEMSAVLTGNYYYVGRWNQRDIDGGGPDTLRFYNEDDVLLGSFSCHQGYWAVEGLFNDIYRLYRHENGLLDLTKLTDIIE